MSLNDKIVWNKKDVHIANTVNGERLYVEVELRERTDKGLTLSICGHTVNPKIRCGDNWVSAGQIIDELDTGNIKTHLMPRPSVEKLQAIWKRWHLNDLNAGCEHQREIIRKEHLEGAGYERLMKMADFQQCPDCGYSYGSAWLFEPIPEDVITELKSLFA